MLRARKSGYFITYKLLLLICYVYGHANHGEFKCSHDTDEAYIVDSLIKQTKLNSQIDRELNRELGESVQRRKLLQSGGDQPIRIHVDYQLDGVNQNLKDLIQEVIIPSTQTILYQTFSIKNGASNQQDNIFFLPARCNETVIVRQNGVPTGESWCVRIQDMCGPHAQQNQDYFLGYTTCSDRNDCQNTPAGTGLTNTDFVLYVTAIQSGSCLQETSQVASAGMCNYDEEAIYGLQNRPLAAFVNFCPNRLEELDTSSEQDMGYAIDTAVHELMHGLFMGRELYQLYVDENGKSYDPVILDSAGVPRFVTSPKVVAAARETFACDTLTNVPLEDEGGEGTAGSHWEKAIFNRELMLGGQTILERSILSPMTLSLAEDSGWYVSNFSNSGQLLQGRGAGCGIFDAQNTCTEQPLPTPLQNQFCNSQDPLYECSNNFQSVGTCPSESIGLIGNCRMLQKVVDLDCGYLQEESPSDIDSADFGSRSGRGTRCLPVQGNEFQRELDPRIFTKLNFGAQCFRVRCLDDKLFFYIPPTQDLPGVELECPENETVTLQNHNLGFKRSLSVGPCPKASDVCTFWGCPHVNGLMCGGQGDCYLGSCQCYLGYKGSDCSQKICTSNSCEQNESCDQQTGDCVPIDKQLSESRITLGDSNQATLSSKDKVVMEGVAFDGYLQGCLIQSQPILGNSELEQPFTATDEFGKYRFQGFNNVPLMIPYDRNCTDVLADFPPLMDLFTPFGSSIISPLSTLVHYMMQNYGEVKEAGMSVNDGLGIPLSVDIYQERDLLKVLGEQQDASLSDRIAYSTSVALAITAQLMSTYLTLDLKSEIGNAFMQQVVDTIVEQKLFSPTNELEIKQQINSLLNRDGLLLSSGNFSPSEEQLLAVSNAIAAYNQAIIQQSRRQGPTGIEFLIEVVGLQRAAYLNATLSIASFRKNEINTQQLEASFEASRIEMVAQTYKPSPEELRQLLGVEESSEGKKFLDKLLDWLQDSQWLDFPGWAWAAVFLTLAIILIGITISILRLYKRECRRSERIYQRRYAPSIE